MERRKILIATKTYPSISQKYRETVCTAGVLLDDENFPLQWIRIYPVRFRYLDFDKKYPRWSIISANIEENDKDFRSESYRIDNDSIKIIRKIDTSNNWDERKRIVLFNQFQNIDEIKNNNLSLGIIKPKAIESSYVEKTEREWPPRQQAILDQIDLFEPSVDLEKIPYKFGYKFTEENQGKSRRYSISDWEILQLYRNCRNNSQKSTQEEKEKEAIKKVRQKLDELSQRDLYFIVGNLKNHPQNFMIIGIFYPPIIQQEDKQLSLF